MGLLSAEGVAGPAARQAESHPEIRALCSPGKAVDSVVKDRFMSGKGMIRAKPVRAWRRERSPSSQRKERQRAGTRLPAERHSLLVPLQATRV